MTTTAVIVQARTGSSRLPGKVLMNLAGRTVLAHVLERCQAVAGADVTCCATTGAADDDRIAAEAERCGAAVFRGGERDVLGRYHGAAQALGADVILRVTSDCPLFDPAVGAAVLDLRAGAGVDFAANNTPPAWPHGFDCEAFTMEALDRAFRHAEEPAQREHVTPWLRTHPGVTRANLDGPGGGLAGHRWTVDYAEDMRFFEALFPHLPPTPALPGMAEVLAVLEAHPHIASINRMRRDGSR